MITNLIKDLISHICFCKTFGFKKLLAVVVLLFITGGIHAQVIANAGEDKYSGLCKLEILQGDASTGTGLTASWRMIEGPQLVNMVGANQINAMFQAFKGGDYYFELPVTDQDNISDKDTVKFTFMDLAAEVMDDVTIGGCESIVLDATKNSTLGEGYTYEWYDDRRLSDNSTSPTFTPGFNDFNRTVKFYFTVRNSFGCEAVDEFDITVKDIPVAAINNNVTEIGCDTLEINGSWSDGYNITYNWYPEEAVKPVAGTPEVVRVSNEISELKLVVEDALGCKDSATYSLGDKQFYVNVGEDIVTGNCRNINLTGQAVGSNDIQWFPESIISTTWRPTQVRVNASAIRNLLASDTSIVIPIIMQAEKDNGCIKKDTMTITATNTAYFFSAGPDLTSGVCGTKLASFVENEYFTSFNWSGTVFNLPENQDQVNKEQPEVYFGNSLAQTSQNVRLNVVDIYGCSKNDPLRITVDKPPLINIPVQEYITNGCKPVQININAANIDSFSWTPSIGLNDPSVEDPLYVGTAAKNITVKGYDKWGCVAQGEVSINSIPLVPNAGSDKNTTQFSSVVIGSGQTVDGYNVSWSLAEPNSEITLDKADEAYCTFTSNVMGTFKVYYLLTDNEFCYLKDSISVTVAFGNRLPEIVSISADTLYVYKDDEITFSFTYSSPDQDPHSVKWLIEGKTYDLASVKVPVTAEGWAVASVSDPYATVMDSIFYRIKPREQVTINRITKTPDSAYVNDAVTIEAFATSEYSNTVSYSWTFLGNTHSEKSFTADLTHEGWAVVTVSDDYTTNKDSLYISFTKEQPVEAFVFNVEPGNTICLGSQFKVNILATGSEVERLNYKIHYAGAKSDMNGSSFNAVESNYIIAQVYNSQYTRKDSILLNVVNSEIKHLNDMFVCFGTQVTVNPNFSVPYSGNLNFYKEGTEVQSATQMKIGYDNAGIYTVYAENIYGCTDTAHVKISAVKLPKALNDELQITEQNETGTIDLSLNDTTISPVYLLSDMPSWGSLSLNNTGDLTFNSSFIAYDVTDTVVYTVHESQCPELKDTAYLLVEFNNAPEVAENNINAFSPNGDGFNQFFEIANIEYYPKNELSIFDKTGNLVYFTKDYKNNWTGKRNKGVGIGKDLPEGTYFYILKTEGQKIKQGFVVLRR